MLMLCKFDIEMDDTHNHFYLELYADEFDDEDGWWLALSPGDATLGQKKGHWQVLPYVQGRKTINIMDSEKVSFATPLRLVGVVFSITDFEKHLAVLFLEAEPPLKVGNSGSGFAGDPFGRTRGFHWKVTSSHWR